ncbi:MAG TPA: hypothetical protein PKI93_01380 [Alphaproteobacteria bacterium]|nr:hypothetical protein [Alphaproteobacteria bacterium]HNS45133.1 hypothetical protein [Alphaproteobacteria bacterium]
MDFLNNIKEFLSDLVDGFKSMFSGGGSTASFSAPQPTVSAEQHYSSSATPIQGFDFSQPQMRPSMDSQAPAPIVDHSVSASRPTAQPTAQPQHIYSPVDAAVQRGQTEIDQSVKGLGHTVENLPNTIMHSIEDALTKRSRGAIGQTETYARASMEAAKNRVLNAIRRNVRPL